MSGPNRPPSSVAPRQAWSPDAGGRGVTCPVCGLANESAARVCRNCGLPIASAVDPLRGVAAGTVDIASPRRAGFSATVGLVLVVALLLIAGTLAVSGGGILSGGGRIGVAPGESPTAAAEADAEQDPPDDDPVEPATTDEPGTVPPATELRHTFPFTCDSGAIRDAMKSRWNISRFLVGVRDGYERITFELTRRNARDDRAAIAEMGWMPPGRARSQYGISRVAGDRAILVTFEGPVTVTANQKVDRLFLDPEGVVAVRSVEMFEGEDGTVRAVIGVDGESCAKLGAPKWKAKSKGKRAKVFLDVQSP